MTLTTSSSTTSPPSGATATAVVSPRVPGSSRSNDHVVATTTPMVVNAIANWLLIYGNLGMPALGVEGAAWATTAARVYMAAFLYVTIRRVHAQRGEAHPRVAFAPDVDRAPRPPR